MIRADEPWEAIARTKFEEWAASPPYEKDLRRYGATSSWPGQYRAADISMAWEAWREASRQLLRIKE